MSLNEIIQALNDSIVIAASLDAEQRHSEAEECLKAAMGLSKPYENEPPQILSEYLRAYKAASKEADRQNHRQALLNSYLAK